MERRNSAKGLDVPVPENGAFPRKENTRGMARSVRRVLVPSYQPGKMIPDPLSLPARSRATSADESHHMSNKLKFLILSLSLMVFCLFVGNPGHGPVFIGRVVCHANYECTRLNLRKAGNRRHRNPPGGTGPLIIAGMFRKLSNDVACMFLKRFPSGQRRRLASGT
jgi:hypothetical protein